MIRERYINSFLSSTLILDLLEDYGKLDWYLHVNCDIDEHRHKLFFYNQTRLENALIKHQVLDKVGSEVANKINNKTHLLLKLN